MKYICEGRECEYVERCTCELIETTTLKEALDGKRIYIRGAVSYSEGGCKRDLLSQREDANVTYQAIYKCRLCGEIFEDVGAWEEATHKFDYFWDGKKKPEGQSDLKDFMDTGLKRHHCTGGSIGIADFQGFKAVKE